MHVKLFGYMMWNFKKIILFIIFYYILYFPKNMYNAFESVRLISQFNFDNSYIHLCHFRQAKYNMQSKGRGNATCRVTLVTSAAVRTHYQNSGKMRSCTAKGGSLISRIVELAPFLIIVTRIAGMKPRLGWTPLCIYNGQRSLNVLRLL